MREFDVAGAPATDVRRYRIKYEECYICHSQRVSRVERDLLCERVPYGILALNGSPRREDPIAPI